MLSPAWPLAQAQGLRWWLQRSGAPTRLTDAGLQCQTVLAAHGPDTAAGADSVLHEIGPGAVGAPVHEAFRASDCVSKSSASFSGLVDALEEAYRTRSVAPREVL